MATGARQQKKQPPPQRVLPFRQNGGRRAGAGRKPNGDKAGVSHAAEGREVSVPQAIDTFTSAPWFDGFRETVTVHDLPATG
ncbi:MAG TPA: hypothetical protein VFZ65_15600 [Planctomycetota bacterium]|nr:hypothetical protein [Planctomycetota bacterium]